MNLNKTVNFHFYGNFGQKMGPTYLGLVSFKFLSLYGRCSTHLKLSMTLSTLDVVGYSGNHSGSLNLKV